MAALRCPSAGRAVFHLARAAEAEAPPHASAPGFRSGPESLRWHGQVELRLHLFPSGLPPRPGRRRDVEAVTDYRTDVRESIPNMFCLRRHGGWPMIPP